MKRMLFNATHAEETRVAIVDGQKLIDIDIETAGREQRKSNIYKGVITRIEPSLEACFVDYGEERHGFLPFKEVSRSYFKEGLDVRTATIREALVEGQEVIVQVEKEERGNKGAAMTTFISLAGRYLVLMPNNPRGGGVSRRIEGEERQELRETMDKLDLPSGMSMIARTAGIGRTAEELQWDLNYLLKLWEAITEAATPQYEYTMLERGRPVTQYINESVRDGKPLKRANPAPFLIVEESNLVIRAIRDYFQPDIGELLVDTDDIFDQARQFMAHVMPDMVNRVKRYREETPLFSRFQIEHQIESAYSRTVPLPSGGAIVIDHTEALVAVDVNSARATRGADIEDTAFRTNMEAADEVARQMRLRDLGGLIVIDFIDMSDTKNQRAIEQRLKEAIHPDRARVQIGKISRFGLMELSRQRLRPALSEGNHVTCPRCNGVGVIRDTESCALQVLRILQEEATKEGTGALHAQVPVDVATYLLNEKRAEVAKVEARYRVPVVLIPNTMLETPHYHIERLRTDDTRLDDSVASYNRAEDLSAQADDPYALKAKEEKPARAKQVPIIKSVMPTEVAPTPEATPAAKTEAKPAKKSFLERVLAFFGIGSDAKSEEEKDDKKGKRDDRRTRTGKRGGRMTREERIERSEKRRSNRAERAAERAAEKQSAEANAQDNRKPRRERDDAKRQEPRANDQTSETVQKTPPALKPVAAEVAQAVKSEERRSRRNRRNRREEPTDNEPIVKVEVPAKAARKSEAEQVEPVAVQAEQPQVVEQVEPQAIEKVESAERVVPTEAEIEQDFADAPENDAEVVIESDSRRRRPRRRRRPTRVNEAVQVMADAPIATETAEPVVSVEQPKLVVELPVEEPAKPEEPVINVAPVVLPAVEETVEEEPAQATDQEPTQAQPEEPIVEPVVAAPAVETPALEPVVVDTPVDPVPEVVVEAEAAPSETAIADGLEENLAKAGLIQVHTDPALVEPYNYEAPKYPGRPRPVLEAIEEGPLIQVHTDPKHFA